MKIRAGRYETGRILELSVWTFLAILIIVFHPYFYSKYYIIMFVFFLMNFCIVLLPKQIRHSLPILIIQVTGVVRYIMMPIVMETESVKIDNDTCFTIMIVEIVASYAAMFLFAVRHKKSILNAATVEKNTEMTNENFKIGISAFILLVFGGAYILYNRDVLKIYVFLSGNKSAVSYESGLIGLLMSVFFVIVYIISLEWIKRLKGMENIVKLLCMLVISLFFVNGSSVTGNNVSRWTMIIIAYIAYIFITNMYPKYKKTLMAVFLIVIIFAVTIGTMLKFGGSGTSNYNSIYSTLKTQFSYKFLNAYFSGPRNFTTALELKDKIETNNIFIPQIIVSDLFANFPLLNRVLSDTTMQSNVLFNYTLYGSSIASDQIIPLASQFYIYFGFLFFVPITIIVYIALKCHFAMIRKENKLLIYGLAYITISFSLINCINLTIMLQNIWIHVLPVFIIYCLNVRSSKIKKKMEIRNDNE